MYALSNLSEASFQLTSSFKIRIYTDLYLWPALLFLFWVMLVIMSLFLLLEF